VTGKIFVGVREGTIEVTAARVAELFRALQEPAIEVVGGGAFIACEIVETTVVDLSGLAGTNA